MRLLLPAPSTQHVDFSDEMRWFYYYDTESVTGDFLTLLTANQPAFALCGTVSPFLLFRNQAERQKFTDYLLGHEASLPDVNPGPVALTAEQAMKQANFNAVIRPLDLGRIAILYTKWQASLDEPYSC